MKERSDECRDFFPSEMINETPNRRESCHEASRTTQNAIELGRTRTNSYTTKIGGKDCQKPMNYEEWSKSNKLEQTLTSNVVQGGMAAGRKKRLFNRGIFHALRGDMRIGAAFVLNVVVVLLR